MEETTEPLINGQEIPNHPSDTTSRKIVGVLGVRDASDGVRLTAGLGRNELAVLMTGERILGHLYRFCILNNKIFHTRESVVLAVKCVDAELDLTDNVHADQD